MKKLYIVRGVSGAGKSEFALDLASGLSSSIIHAADDFFVDAEGDYNFDASLLGLAHHECRTAVEKSLVNDVTNVFVCNTFTQEWEMSAYVKMAERYGYRVVSLIVENRHGSENMHGVPSETLQKMKDRFQIKL